MRQATIHAPSPTDVPHVPEGTDLIEWYYECGYSDGLPLVPPTLEKIAATVAQLGGEPGRVVSRVPPRWGSLTREVLAVNMVMAGCRSEYAPVVEAAILAVRIAEDVHVDERVVERGVEDAPLRRCAARHIDPSEHPVPRLARVGLHRVERGLRRLVGGEIGASDGAAADERLRELGEGREGGHGPAGRRGRRRDRHRPIVPHGRQHPFAARGNPPAARASVSVAPPLPVSRDSDLLWNGRPEALVAGRSAAYGRDADRPAAGGRDGWIVRPRTRRAASRW